MRLIIFLFVFALIITGCTPAQKTQTSQPGTYSEDLSSLRPKVEDQTKNIIGAAESKREPKVFIEKPLFTVNKQLDAVLDSIDRINLTRKFIEGYTIQIYAGPKREDALSAKKQLTIALPELESELQYVQPNFRVKAGKYFTLLEAEKDYEQVRQYFQSAIVVPDKIAIN